MKNHAVLEGLLRPPIEAYSTLVAWSVALVAIVAPWALMMPRWIGLVAAAAAAWFGWVRLQQALRIMRYQHGMKWYTVTRMAPSRVPVAPDKLYLGQGFEWTQQHTQRLRDAMQVDAKPYVTPSALETRLRQLGRNALEQSETKGTRPLTARLAAIDSWANPLHPYPDLGGSPVLHGVGVLDEVPIALRQSARSGHLLVMGTTRVGKTRLLEMLATQDIHAGKVTIVIDPKGDADLMLRMYAGPSAPADWTSSTCSTWATRRFPRATTASATSRASPRWPPALPTPCPPRATRLPSRNSPGASRTSWPRRKSRLAESRPTSRC